MRRRKDTFFWIGRWPINLHIARPVGRCKPSGKRAVGSCVADDEKSRFSLAFTTLVSGAQFYEARHSFLDIVPGERFFSVFHLDVDAIAAFVRKHDLASAPANVAPIMPFLIADGFSGKAFGLARSRGILATTTSHLFGEDVAKALRDLISLLADTGATASVNPDHVERVLNSLTRIEGAANNLRGALFEIIVGSLVKDVEGGYLRSGEKWKDYETGRTAETDVLLGRPDDKGPLVVECKAKIPGARVNLEEVQKWRDDRVPLLHKIFKTDSRLSGKHVTFELWTNGPIGADALEWLKAHPAPTDYSVGWKDGDAMKPYVEKASSTAIRSAMRDHYFHHPLAKIAAQAERNAAIASV
ncbi:hypothetical protein [Bradyrhizobium sp. CCBAU 11434]|uniref:hypothetical protein n=1 Tax=Bradyrhizobium sp. CCBAU 11434 TaxID=1630885 RepID=UPI002305C30D|nr:hypothetical protein [Bradyrhizobium sp. CCBAU 11434]